MITVLCSAAGSPGVTTTALALALREEGPSLLVDVDRDPAQAVLAGWLGGCQPRGRGIVPLVQERAGVAELDRFTVSLDERDHAFLPGFPAGANVTAFGAAWGQLARVLRAASTNGTRVVVDAGRVGATGLPTPLLEAADTVVLVCRSSLRSLVAARLAVGHLADARRAGVVLIGPDDPYGAKEISEALGLPVLGSLPSEPREAAVVSEGETPGRRHEQSALVRGWSTLAHNLAVPAEGAA